MIGIFITSFATVFLAELVGDKNLLMVLSLGVRFRRFVVSKGVLLAIAAKMGLAVLFGRLLLQVPRPVTTVVTALAFVVASLLVVFEREGQQQPKWGWREATTPNVMAFTTVFLSEWCDPGQLAVAALSVKYQAPFTVGLAGISAMSAKLSLALLAGNHLPSVVPQMVIRYSLFFALLIAGIFSLFKIIT